MNRQQKEAVVADLKNKFSTSDAAFLVGYKGLSVAAIHILRKQLREVDGIFKVTKARLMKKATEDIKNIDNFSADFKNQIGLVFAKDKVTAVAKKLEDFARDHENLQIISGFFESKFLSKPEIDYLASIPSREVLLAQLIGMMQSPLSELVRVLIKMAEQKEK